MSRSYILICSLLMAVSAFSVQARAADNGLTANPVYQNNCAKCHGKAAQGRLFGGPSLVAAKTQAASEEELINVITNGKGHMPKYSGILTAAEIKTLVDQIREPNKK